MICRILQVSLSLYAALFAAGRSGQDCDELERLIHGNWSTILSASSAVESVDNASLPGGQGWCSESLLGAQAPWLEASFPQPVRVEVLSISGSAGEDSHAVTSFYLQYGEIREDQPWQCSPYVQGPISVPYGVDNATVHNISLRSPLLTSRLRILLWTWSTSPPCLRVEAYGCASDDEGSAMLPADPTTGSEVEKDYLVVKAGVPIAVATVVVVLVIIGAGVALRIVYKRTADKKLQLLTLPQGAVRYVPSTSATTQECEPCRNSGAGNTLRYMDNTLYRLTKVEVDAAPDIYSSYQSIHFQQVDDISMSVDMAIEPDLTETDLTEKGARVNQGSGAEIAVSNPMFQHNTDQVTEHHTPQ